MFRLIGRVLYKVVSPSGYFFFFPVAGMGGAERVHLHILATLPIKKSLIVFETSYRPDWVNKFKKYGRTWFADFYLKFPRLHRLTGDIFWDVIIGAINKHTSPKIFLGQLVSHNRLINQLSSKVWIADIVHAEVLHDGKDSEGLKYWRMDLVPNLAKRYLVSGHLHQQLSELYLKNGLSIYTKNLRVISNFVDIPSNEEYSSFKKKKKIVFLGREAYEKRIHLAGEIAKNLSLSNPEIENVFIGPSEESVNLECRAHIRFTGALSDRNQISLELENASIILFTSSYEGLPLSLMEAMAHGVVPVSTAVGGIITHVNDGQNGYLIKEGNDKSIVESATEIITTLFSDTHYLSKLSQNAYHYAAENFKRDNYENKLLEFFEVGHQVPD